MKNYPSHIPTQKSIYKCKDRREEKGRIYPVKMKTNDGYCISLLSQYIDIFCLKCVSLPGFQFGGHAVIDMWLSLLEVQRFTFKFPFNL